MKKCLHLIATLLFMQSNTVWSEHKNPWKQVSANVSQRDFQTGRYPEGIFQYFTLNVNQLRKQLNNLKAAQNIIRLPNPAGEFQAFRITEKSVMTDALANRYPTIKTWSGTGITDPFARVKLDLTDKGFHAMVLGHGYNFYFIDPDTSVEDYYVSYARKNFNAAKIHNEDFEAVFSNGILNEISVVNVRAPKLRSSLLRRYRLALAATGEFTRFQGGKTRALAAQVTTINRVNAIYERDLSITLILVADNDKLLFTDEKTDPYTVGNVDKMMTENQQTIDKLIGNENYDIGHVFYALASANGVANQGAVCHDDEKARGVTGSENPDLDSFITDFVSHEIGHQFGANHTLSANCSANPDTAVEPGSGSTIMSYAGICDPDVQQHNDPYFHAINLEEMTRYIQTEGDTCAEKISVANNRPEIRAIPRQFTIPQNTPFFLTGIATDADKNRLTYTWEQNNPNTNVPMPPRGNFTNGPLVRSFPPSPVPIRFFPSLTDLIDQTDHIWQVLPTKSAKLNFKLAVRDNDQFAGSFDTGSVQVNVLDSAGPFVVASPEESIWNQGETYQIKWDVASTNQAPINCTTVDLLLVSKDPKPSMRTIAVNQSNSGSAMITAPDKKSDKAFIIVRCHNNIFFSISPKSVTIK